METIKFAAVKTTAIARKTVLFLSIICLMSSCSQEDQVRYDNPYLTDISFRMNLNLSLPEYNSLNFPGNSYVSYNYGINGVVVYNINNTQYTAFELSDPNHSLRDCSRLTVQGIIASCTCEDGNSYNILTGEITAGTGQYSLKPYRIRKSGNVLEVFN